jgi:hypothetical protein
MDARLPRQVGHVLLCRQCMMMLARASWRVREQLRP